MAIGARNARRAVHGSAHPIRIDDELGRIVQPAEQRRVGVAHEAHIVLLRHRGAGRRWQNASEEGQC
jgi:hypothetical protein